MLDEYRRGHVERISPEAPVPILKVVGYEATLGGAGNVVANLRSLGVGVAVAGVSGEDATGDRIVALLQRLGVDGESVIRDPERVSTRKIRFVSLEHGQQVFRVDEESLHPICDTVEKTIMNLLREKASAAQVILCSDYLKGLLTKNVLRAAFVVGRERGIPVIVAPKDSNALIYKGANVLMPNLKELAKLVETPVNGDHWLTDSAQRLTATLDLEALLVTRGSDGMSLFEQARSGLRRVDIPTTARKVYDVTGAGDTAIAAFAASVASGTSFETAAYLANVAAGIVVGKHGTATAAIEEIKNHFMNQAPLSSERYEEAGVLRTASGQ
jgi:D-beta-D-heptose 7-phosphate kinase / D-beta-D-heptose 1-phosphate adenosyltransferase